MKKERSENSLCNRVLRDGERYERTVLVFARAISGARSAEIKNRPTYFMNIRESLCFVVFHTLAYAINASVAPANPIRHTSATVYSQRSIFVEGHFITKKKKKTKSSWIRYATTLVQCRSTINIIRTELDNVPPFFLNRIKGLCTIGARHCLSTRINMSGSVISVSKIRIDICNVCTV